MDVFGVTQPVWPDTSSIERCLDRHVADADTSVGPHATMPARGQGLGVPTALLAALVFIKRITFGELTLPLHLEKCRQVRSRKMSTFTKPNCPRPL